MGQEHAEILWDTELRFIESVDKVSQKIHHLAKSNGFWDNERNDGEIIALIHSELSEALEGIRHGCPPDDKLNNRSSVEVELADAVIRIMDYCYAKGFDLGGAILDKHAYNRTRPYKHGKEF